MGQMHEHPNGRMSAYGSLVLQTVISGIVMYLVMFVMIDSVDSFYNNLNMFYMTLMMVAPMATLTARPPFDAMNREKALPSSSIVSEFKLI